MIRVDIETIIMAAGPVPSVIVLRERNESGSFEAAAISRGIDRTEEPRPITHDLMNAALTALDAKVERVEINRVDLPVFFADLVVLDKDGKELSIDARPSDALALAVRVNAPIYVEDDVMNRAGSISARSDDNAEEEIERFDEFVQTLSPDDF